MINRRFILRNDTIKQRAAGFIAGFNPDDGRLYENITRPVKSKRSLEQNSYIHKLLHDIADFMGDTTDSVKAEMKMKFLEPSTQIELPDGRIWVQFPSTADMRVHELTEFAQRIEAFAITELGFIRGS